jgi:hypothetical protein
MAFCTEKFSGFAVILAGKQKNMQGMIKNGRWR